MKKFFSVLLILACVSLPGQAQLAPGFRYQAVIRTENGEILRNQAIRLRISILKGSLGGEAAYTETHLDTTSAFGLVSLMIGEGSNR
ncbi:MAG: hypothetical protein U0T82_15060 [Bacteroidales bacterium]